MDTSKSFPMNRRSFILSTMNLAASVAISPRELLAEARKFDAEYYRRHRKFLDVDQGRVAYLEKGHGPPALFLHGFPLNGYQWRGALERLHTLRRCIAPDLMGMGCSEIRDDVAITPNSQVDMLASFLDRLRIREVDLITDNKASVSCNPRI
ncbi:alpha/beta fold hydrolase [Edaphobacter albus]|uniref:alpha/beta fold hydrolase n=1 Tax=Edaphobacter sp. 4G125 TaxID=2763071 RepID=UPI0016492809|nr:alpha/beta fold hydrolase [Edaphobacter sp. 4G125]QNI36023.1 hypothetical protein H7846_13585 [Edaphobacter sp. 4G125]